MNQATKMALKIPVCLLGALLVAGIPAFAQDLAPASSQPDILTLNQAVALAQANNRQLKISYQNVLAANEQILSARAQRYPQFNVELTGSSLLSPVSVEFRKNAFGELDGLPNPAKNISITTDPHFSGMFRIEAYQPLSQLYNIHLNLETLAIAKKLTEEQLRQQRQQITNSVESAYYGLLQTESAVAAATQNVSALEELNRTTAENVQEKTALPYQSSGVAAQLAQAEVQVMTLEDTLATQKENLNDLMGRDIRTEFGLAGVPESLPAESDLETARQTALGNRSEIRQAQFKIDQAQYARRSEKALYIPQIGVQYLYFSPFTAQGLPQNINVLGIDFKWDIFDWGYKRHQLAAKDTVIVQSQLNLTETQTQVLIDLDNNFRKLREARANLNVAQLGRDAESQKLAVVLEQYKQKTALLSDAQQERANMANADAQYQQALSNFWTARANFQKSLGED
jgi:outer membrane protein